VSYSEILAIVGDIVRVKVPEEESSNGISPCLEDLAVLEAVDGNLSLAQVIGIKRDVVALQVFNGTRGISTNFIVRFLGHPMQASYSGNIFGRVFRGTGEPIDGGPDLANDPKVTIGGPSVNPMRRILASKMIRTNVTGLFKNLNYAQEDTAQHKEFLGKIQELAGSTANQIAKSQ
jgi:V/A-type H+-transporting ATPase subunit B